MSTHTVGTLQRISAKALSELILAEADSQDPSFAVVDVRDDDYIGGHIKGCVNVPSSTLDAMMPTLVRRFEPKKTVVFHCALSQMRGPGAALKYLRLREESLAKKQKTAEASGGECKPEEQKVLVLDRGFVGWQETYGEDERLTEGYSKELWRENY